MAKSINNNKTNNKGRGAENNPSNRFESFSYEADWEHFDPAMWEEDEHPALETEFLRDYSQKVITYNNSPDVGFDASLNPYRGCEHGCIYCYARPTHEYLGFSAGLDFETKIMVKEKAPELLREELLQPKWKPQVLVLSGVTDPYQLIERKLRLTRRCLAVLLEFRNPVSIITKNALVARDRDLLSELAKVNAAQVAISVTSLDPKLKKVLEPRASAPQKRLDAIRKLSQSGVPVGAMVAPIIPGLNDHEVPAILEAVEKAGALFANYVVLRLPHGLKGLFEDWLEQHFPTKRKKVLDRIRSMRGGCLYDAQFGTRMCGEGPIAEQMNQLFQVASNKVGLPKKEITLTAAHFQKPVEGQLEFL